MKMSVKNDVYFNWNLKYILREVIREKLPSHHFSLLMISLIYLFVAEYFYGNLPYH